MIVLQADIPIYWDGLQEMLPNLQKNGVTLMMLDTSSQSQSTTRSAVQLQLMR
jgi:glycine cleavage system regulatory protein